MTNISIIIPFFNEENNISNLVNALNDFCRKSELFYEIIFVDDGSTDSSCNKLENQSIKFFDAKVIKLSKNYGSHAALRAGIKNAKGKYIGFSYADLQDPLELQHQMYNTAKNKKANIVWGSRRKTKNSISETFFSSIYAFLMRKFVNKKFPSKGFDVVLFDEKVKNELNNNIEANSSIFLQILSLGFKQETICYNKQERKKGKSKWTLSKKMKLFIDSFVAFSYFPIKLVTVTGIMFFILGFIWTIYIVFRELFVGDLDSGWPALVSILMIGFGVTNIGLGIIAEYLWRTLDVSRKRPVYIIDEIFELTNHE